jgi:hypothetical protein
MRNPVAKRFVVVQGAQDVGMAPQLPAQTVAPRDRTGFTASVRFQVQVCPFDKGCNVFFMSFIRHRVRLVNDNRPDFL